MKHAPLLLLLASGGLFGWFAPDLLRGEPAPVPEAEPEPVRQVSAPAVDTAPLAGDDVVLPRAADGHFYAEVVVGSASTLMLVDTGASVVALTGEDARAVGITWDSSQMERVARGAGGDVYGVRVVLAKLQLGPLEARSVEAVVVPEGLEVSLLGQSFLSQVARVEIDRQKMVLGG